MRRPLVFFSAMIISSIFAANVALAQDAMKPTAPDKMMSPADKQKMQDCQRLAAQRNIKMNERSKFVMDCMTGKVK